MALLFNRLVMHGGVVLEPGVIYGFDDPDAEAYFLALGWAEAVPDAPEKVSGIEIDPLTVRASDGQYVLPERAHARLAENAAARAAGRPVKEPHIKLTPRS